MNGMGRKRMLHLPLFTFPFSGPSPLSHCLSSPQERDSTHARVDNGGRDASESAGFRSFPGIS